MFDVYLQFTICVYVYVYSYIVGLLFLKPEATLFEVFPFRYFKPTYRDICHQYGLNHQYIQNTAPTSLSRQVLRMVGEAQCMSNKKCRSFARGDDVHMTENHIQVVIDTMKSIEVLHKI